MGSARKAAILGSSVGIPWREGSPLREELELLFRRHGIVLEGSPDLEHGLAAGAELFLLSRDAPVAPTSIDEAPLALSPRQRQIAELAVRGRTRSEIARALAIKPESVKTQLARIRRKVGVRNTYELADLLHAGLLHTRSWPEKAGGSRSGSGGRRASQDRDR